MHWFAFAILLYVVLVLQTTLAPALATHAVRPDFVIIMATYYAMMARPIDAVLSCWIIGFAMDLAGLSYNGYSNVGISAFSLGLIAMIVVRIRELIFRESPVTQLLLAFSIKLVFAMMIGFHMLYVLGRGEELSHVFTTAFWAAVYTGMLAPYGHWMMRKLRPTLGLGVPHHMRVS